MDIAPPSGTTAPRSILRLVALAGVAAALVAWASPAPALVAGIIFALAIGHPSSVRGRTATRWLLQGCVVALGFGMNLPVVLRLGLNGSLFAASTIGFTLLAGRWIGGRLKLDGKTGWLVSVGTAICGGSAIAAVSSAIGATEAQIAVSMGTIFMLNGVALWTFPILGQMLHLSQAQFGLWAGVSIHDLSSVVGAGMAYGPEALATATAVKLSRTLWIIPLTLATGIVSRREASGSPPPGAAPGRRAARVAIPWFIGLFLLASLARSVIPAVAGWSPRVDVVAHRGMVLVLFLIGISLSPHALRSVGWRAVATGLALWALISAGSLLVIRLLHLSA